METQAPIHHVPFGYIITPPQPPTLLFRKKVTEPHMASRHHGRAGLLSISSTPLSLSLSLSSLYTGENEN